jgi:hypothetical protein
LLSLYSRGSEAIDRQPKIRAHSGPTRQKRKLIAPSRDQNSNR